MGTEANDMIKVSEIMNTSDDNLGDATMADSRNLIKEEVIVWAILDGILLVAILSGNILTILAVRYSRRLRGVISNQFVLSLAISDILVGLTLPYHLAFYLSTELGESKHFCLLRFFLVILACCVSIWNLIAIALDRYIAICYPLHYSRYMTRKIAVCLMSSGWIVGFTIAAIPLVWNKWDSAYNCEFDQIFYPWYMVGVVTPVFSLVWFTMFFVYCRIWREASKHVKQLKVTGQQEGTSDWKSVQMVLLILGCFTVSWLPYFIVACTQIYKISGNNSAIAYMAAFTLAMSNSAMNPVIYAWKNSNFRQAFTNLLKCKSPDTLEPSQSMRSNLHRKSSSAQHQESISGAFPNYSTPPFAKKNEPIAAMGITFEEDEEILAHESTTPSTTSNTAKPKTSSLSFSNHSNPVTIKIESDMRRNSVIISTSTLPSTDVITVRDDSIENSAIIRTLDSPIVVEIKQQNSLESNRQQNNNKNENTMMTGNLIVNKLIEDYEYDTDSGCGGESIRKFKENLLSTNGGAALAIISEDSKRKSKSTNSIVITKCPNKSNSHGSIFNCDDKHQQYLNGNAVSNGISQNKNLLTTFHFGKKYISKSFNSAVEDMDRWNKGADQTSFRKSAIENNQQA